VSADERTFQRDLTYGLWHRWRNIKQFVGEDAKFLTQIDIDFCEYCIHCNTPLALIETQRSVRDPKNARVTENLARMAGIEAYSVSYAVGSEGVIESFRVRQLAPVRSEVFALTPYMYARFVRSLRIGHVCDDSQHDRSSGDGVRVQRAS
jgi:hypothetical protein